MCDFVMTGGNGLEALASIKERLPSAKRVLFSGFWGLDKMSAYPEIVDACWQEPIGADEFFQIIIGLFPEHNIIIPQT